MTKVEDLLKEQKVALHTLIGKLGYLRRVCPRARLTLDILVGLIKEGKTLWVERMEKFTFITFESRNLTINPKGGVLLTLNVPKE